MKERRQGFIVEDHSDYFAVAWECGGGGRDTYGKSFNGFQTAEELADYIERRHAIPND